MYERSSAHLMRAMKDSIAWHAEGMKNATNTEDREYHEHQFKFLTGQLKQLKLNERR